MDGVLILVPLAVIACGLIAVALGSFRPAHIYSRRSGALAALAGVALLFVIARSLPVIGTPALGELPTAVATPIDHSDQAGYPYPQSALSRFANDCERNATHTLCVCMYGSLERHYSYRQFEALVAADNPKAPEYTVVAQDCAGK